MPGPRKSKSRRWRRRLALWCAVWLPVGVVLTCVTSWACEHVRRGDFDAMSTGQEPRLPSVVLDRVRGWPRWAVGEPWATTIEPGVGFGSWCWRTEVESAVGSPLPLGKLQRVEVERFWVGWPTRAMRTTRVWKFTSLGYGTWVSGAEAEPIGLIGKLQRGHQSFSPRTFPPTWPLWPALPGFVMNTMFYGVVGWLTVRGMVWIVRAGTRRVRRKRGQCVVCEYDVSGLDRCPECGYAK
jgi:hypothetical protein